MSAAAPVWTEALVGLGANLGDAPQALRDAAAAMRVEPQIRALRQSSLYRSAPVDAAGPDYFNAVVAFQTRLTPLALLRVLQAIEQRAGRERPYRNAPRTLDLDLLWYGDVTLDTPELTLPHPRWAERAFVLWPVAELAPQRIPASAWAAVQGQRIERVSE